MDIANNGIDAQNYTIMIVDDIPVNTRLLEKILEKEKFQIKVFNNSTHALEAMPEVNPDILLLDIMMPGLDGISFLQRVRANSKYDHTRIIMVTAVNEADEIVKANAAGANDYITKPINSNRLLSCVFNQIEQISK